MKPRESRSCVSLVLGRSHLALDVETAKGTFREVVTVPAISLMEAGWLLSLAQPHSTSARPFLPVHYDLNSRQGRSSLRSLALLIRRTLA
jgi:hypothetical protein